ncbi:MAG: hypothetical protein Q4A12_01980 [Eubacteriales bacterium]|nr:hypothetical protein [Eubacteriales bacterium]
MYLRPVIYKIFSVLVLLAGALVGAATIIGALCYDTVCEAIPVLEKIPFDSNSTIALLAACVVGVVIILASYVEFSALYSFAEMIAYENSGSVEPMKKKGFVLPAKFFGGFGSAIYIVNLLACIVLGAYFIISYSITKDALVALPIIPLVIIIVENIFVSVHFNLRFRAISDMMRVNGGEESERLRQNVAEIKTGSLRAYCKFFVLLCLLTVVGTVIAAFMTGGTLIDTLGTTGGILAIIGEFVAMIIAVLCMGIFGCYVDNLAKMVEHHQMKYGVFKS